MGSSSSALELSAKFEKAATLLPQATQPGVLAAAAVPVWTVSCLLAQHVLVTAGGFIDFWMGAVSIVTGLAAVALTGTAVFGVVDGIDTMLKN